MRLVYLSPSSDSSGGARRVMIRGLRDRGTGGGSASVSTRGFLPRGGGGGGGGASSES